MVRLFISKPYYEMIIQKFAIPYKILNTFFWIDIFIGLATIIIPILQAKGILKTKLNFDKPWINKYQNFAFVATLLLLPILRLYEVFGFDWQTILLVLMSVWMMFVIKRIKSNPNLSKLFLKE